MLHETTLTEIRSNTNPGVEYEIALFYKLLSQGSDDASSVMSAILSRSDAQKIIDIIKITDENIILNQLQEKGYDLMDVSFETQNDNIGPADLMMIVKGVNVSLYKIGLSVKFNNKNTLNPTARKFITDKQIDELNILFKEVYIPAFIEEMKEKYGNVSNWKRKRSETANIFYDLVRDAVIENWPNISNKTTLFAALFHADSPIPFWVINYTKNGLYLETEPETVDESRVNDIIVEKYKDAFIAFKLDNKIIGKVQVKCNNGFIEDQFNHAGKAKRKNPDFKIDGQPKIMGDPFGSWDFTSGK